MRLESYLANSSDNKNDCLILLITLPGISSTILNILLTLSNCRLKIRKALITFSRYTFINIKFLPTRFQTDTSTVSHLIQILSVPRRQLLAENFACDIIVKAVISSKKKKTIEFEMRSIIQYLRSAHFSISNDRLCGSN